MIDTAKGRVFVVLLLLLGQTALFPLYAQQSTAPEAGVFPNADEISTNPDAYLGAQVVMEGTVYRTSPLVIEVRSGPDTHYLTVVDSGLSPRRGDKLRVYGTFVGDGTITSDFAFAVPRSGLWYTWTVSFLAGLWVLGRLIRHWTLDLSRLSFSWRAEPLALLDVVNRYLGGW